jgi:WD40 repeat protein/3',5'-cyclic AMP phosphodiesterase CpdA
MDTQEDGQDPARSPTEFRLRILHLSDLHERGPREEHRWRRRRVLGDAWTKNLGELTKADDLDWPTEKPPVDLVCFTGDVAFSGKDDEYKEATDFLKDLMKRVGLPMERLFPVPGNHDVDRSLGLPDGKKMTEEEWDTLRERLLACARADLGDWARGQAVRGLDQELCRRVLSRGEVYRTWLETELRRSDLLPQHSSHGRLGYRAELRPKHLPFPIHVIGLDSAWLAGSSRDAERLLLTEEQVGRLCTRDGEQLDGLRIALVHHPLTGLADGAECRRLLADNVDLLLRGHLHEEELEAWQDPDRGIRQLTAGCLYEDGGDRTPNAFHVIEVALNERGRPCRFNLRFRRWSPRGGHWYDDNSLYSKARNGQLMWNASGAAPAPRAHAPSRPIPKPPPPAVVARPLEFDRAKSLLLAPRSSRSVALSTALAGAGGYGKTTLAQALCADREIQEAFAGGIFWVDAGQAPNILRQLGLLYAELTGADLPTTDERAASALVAGQLRPHSLLVVDDVWQKVHLRAFLDAVAPSGRCLISTRVADILDEDAELVRVDEMQPDQAVALLLRGIEAEAAGLDDALRDLARRLGHWALLLELANAKLRIALRRRGQTLAAALDSVVADYQARGIVAFDRGEVTKRNDAAGKSLELSLALLADEERTRYCDLGIFPEDTSIPCAVAADLWGVDIGAAEAALLRLDDLSLLKYLAPEQAFRLHDVCYDWLRRRGAGLDVHRRLVERWGDPFHLPHAYAWRWIGWHLLRAERSEQLCQLLLDAAWVESKLRWAGLESLIAECELVQPSKPHRLLKCALTHSAHVLSERPGALADQLHARLMAVDDSGLAQLLGQLRTRLGTIVPVWPSLLQADSPLHRTLQGHQSQVVALALSSDARTLFSGEAFGMGGIKVWDVSTGRLIRELGAPGGSDVAVLALSSDGRVLVSGSSGDKRIRVWETATGRRTHELKGHTLGVGALALSNDGRTLYSGADDRPWFFQSQDSGIRVWDLAVGRQVGSLAGHKAAVCALRLSVEGETLVSGSRDCAIKIWDLSMGRAVHTLEGHTGWVSALALSRDGRTLYSGAGGQYGSRAEPDRVIRAWDLVNGREAGRLEGHADRVTALALSSDGRTLVSSSRDATIKVWDVEQGRAVSTIEGVGDSVNALALSADGRTLVSGSSNRQIQIWDIGGRAAVVASCARRREVKAVDFGWDGRTLACGAGDGSIAFLDLATGRVARTLRSDAGLGHGWDEGVVALAFGSDGRTLCACRGEAIQIWDLTLGRLVGGLPQRYRPHALALSRDGRTLLAGSYDKTIEVWDLTAGRKTGTLKGHAKGVKALALSSDGRTLVSASYDGTTKVWDLASKRIVRTLEGRAGRSDCVALMGDGRAFVSAGEGAITLMDLATGEQIRTLEGRSGSVSSLALSADSRLLVTGSQSKTVEAWDLMTGRRLGQFCADAAIGCVAISPRSAPRTVVAGDASGRVHLFELRSDLF